MVHTHRLYRRPGYLTDLKLTDVCVTTSRGKCNANYRELFAETTKKKVTWGISKAELVLKYCKSEAVTRCLHAVYCWDAAPRRKQRGGATLPGSYAFLIRHPSISKCFARNTEARLLYFGLFSKAAPFWTLSVTLTIDVRLLSDRELTSWTMKGIIVLALVLLLVAGKFTRATTWLSS